MLRCGSCSIFPRMGRRGETIRPLSTALLVAPTARQYAPLVGLRYSTSLLSNPEANIRMGTRYLSDLIKQFGSAHLALASYNAGETPVRRWMNEFQGYDVDEFIDSITYPETQNYVKKVLSMAEDYRALYGGTQ